MEQTKFSIGNEQTKVFARAIYMNISAYIQDHQEEYQKFILEEQKENGKD